MRGLADGTGADYNQVLHIHMLPELVKVNISHALHRIIIFCTYNRLAAQC